MSPSRADSEQTAGDVVAEATSRLGRLFRLSGSGERHSGSHHQGNRPKAFTLPFGLLNRRKRTSPHDIDTEQNGRPRAATDYGKERKFQMQQRLSEQHAAMDPRPPFVDSHQNAVGAQVHHSRPISSPTTPAATETPKARRRTLPSSPRDVKFAGESALKDKGKAVSRSPPRLPMALPRPPADEAAGHDMPRRRSTISQATSSRLHQSTDSPSASPTTPIAPRQRRPSYTLAARGGTLMISDWHEPLSAPPNQAATASIGSTPPASSPSKSSPSPPGTRARATTIQGATPILPSQRGKHGSTSAEALAQATGDSSFSLQRVRRTFSDAFRQNRARQFALERISTGQNINDQSGDRGPSYRPGLQDMEEQSEGSHQGQMYRQSQDQSRNSQVSAGFDRAAHDSTNEEDNDATLVAARGGRGPPKALPWANAMLTDHHHLTPVGEVPDRESMQFPTLSLPQGEGAASVSTPTVLSPVGKVPPGQESTDLSKKGMLSGDATAVEPVSVVNPNPPSRKSSLHKLKAELVHSFLANSRGPESGMTVKQSRGDEVDSPFTHSYMRHERSATDGAKPLPVNPTLSPSASAHSLAPSHGASYAHSSYHSHFSPTTTQQMLYASKQRLIGPLEEQLAQLDSQFNSIFHALEVRRLESQYSDLQRRIREKQMIVEELERALKEEGPAAFGAAALQAAAPAGAAQQASSESDSLHVTASETQHQHGGDPKDEPLSYDDQRVEVIAAAPDEPEPASTQRTQSIPIRVPELARSDSSNTVAPFGGTQEDSMPKSPSAGGSRVASFGTFGVANRRSLEEAVGGGGGAIRLALPPGLVRNQSELSSQSNATTRSLVGAEGVISKPPPKAPSMQRSESLRSDATKGWESSPTLPKGGLAMV